MPTLSVIVPVYNGGEHLERCLAALAGSQCEDFEVVVADDGSIEPVEPLVARHGFKYLRVSERGQPGGPARARNRGVEASGGRYLAFIDADVCVHAETLARLAAALTADSSLAAVIGCYDEAPAEPGFLSQYKNLFHHYVHETSRGEVSVFWSGCGAMRRELFLAFGGFDQERYRRPAIEDIELGTWLSAAGHRIALDRSIQAKHLKRWTLRNLLKTDIFDRGIPWTRLMWRAGKLVGTLNVKPGQRVSVALVYLSLLALALGWWWAAALLAVAVTVINRDFYRFMARRRGFWFAVRTAPMHWLYFIYCGGCVVAGTALHFLSGGLRMKRMRRISE